MNPSNRMFSILTRNVRPKLSVIINTKFKEAKANLLSAVENHPISKDISSHAPSKFLGSSSGTLYGFLGFNASQVDPVADLVHFLDEFIVLFENPPTKRSLYSTSIRLPQKEAFNRSEFLLGWISRGWPVMIEEGVSGLPFYLNKSHPVSRSLEGFQVKNKVRAKDFTGVPYLTPLISDFRKSLLL